MKKTLLYDDLKKSPGVSDAIKDVLNDAYVVRAQNVANWYWEDSDQEDWDICKDFPIIVPPHHRLFIEYRNPSQINSLGKFLNHTLAGWKMGLLFTRWDAGDPQNYGAVSQAFDDQGIRWMVDVALFASTDEQILFFDQNPLNPIMLRWTYGIDEKGKLWRDSNDRSRLFLGLQVSPGLYTTGPKELQSAMQAQMKLYQGNFLRSLLDVGLMTISFMHWKGVEVVEITPPSLGSPSKGNKRNRHGLHFDSRYHILKIEPTKKILKDEGRSDELGNKKALHICRGHFKDYRESGLFGKIKEIVWVNEHTRGSIVNGVVGKDYSIGEIHDQS